MLLAIDCGNTNTVFSIWDGVRFLATWRMATDHKRTADEYFVWLSALMALNRVEAVVTEAIISSTVPRVVFNLRVLCDRYFSCRPLVVGRAGLSVAGGAACRSGHDGRAGPVGQHCRRV